MKGLKGLKAMKKRFVFFECYLLVYNLWQIGLIWWACAHAIFTDSQLHCIRAIKLGPVTLQFVYFAYSDKKESRPSPDVSSFSLYTYT